ncbi:uncharacterized protein LOC103521469 [Diaphorina citri]|uniref:Uncharacterized protein LOC103521469 n=1 Tax=Diaphorina citri TaxID=121845 RepID=A0A1S3DN01_DIACI|nr:uncharacterized protein LOC103521469 [Diaphorina citri]
MNVASHYGPYYPGQNLTYMCGLHVPWLNHNTLLAKSDYEHANDLKSKLKSGTKLDLTKTETRAHARSKEPNVSKYFDTSPPDLMDKYHSKRGAAKLPEQGSGVSASTTGDELVRKYKREMSTPNAKNSKPQEGNNLTQHEVNFPQDLPMSTPSSSSLPNI